MSKNTNISELINYLSYDGSGNIVFTTVSAATTNTDKFLVSDAGTLKFRTAAQLLSDIGAQASGSYQAALSGTGFVKISGSTISYDNSTYLTTSSASSTYLPLSGGTLTGALGGTSATFSGNVRINAAINGTNKLIFGIAATDYYWLEYNDATGNIGYSSKYNHIFYGGGSGTTQILSLANNGVATFSSTIIAGNSANSSSSESLFLKGKAITSGGAGPYGDYGSIVLSADSSYTSGARRYLITSAYSSNRFGIIQSVDSTTTPTLGDNGAITSGNLIFHILNTGAAVFSVPLSGTSATFSSTISASGGISTTGSITSTVGGTSELRLQGGGYGGSYNTSLRSMGGAVGILQFGNNGENYVLIGNTGTSSNTFLSFRVNCTTEATNSGTEAFRITSTGAGNSSAYFTGALSVQNTIESRAAQGNIRAYSTNPDNDAIVGAFWTGDVGLEMRYNPNTAVSYIQNSYAAEINQEFGDIHFRRKISGSFTTTMIVKGYSSNVGIGVLTPTAKLHVFGTAKFDDANGITLASNTQYRQMYFDGFSNLYFWNGSNQSLLSSAGVWTNASDISIKKDIIDIKYGLSELMNLSPRSYKMITDNLEQIGFIAQEVQQVIPEVVTSDNKGMKALSYGNLLALAVKAIQELKVENDSLKDILKRNNII